MSCIATVGKAGMTVQDSVTNQQINSVIVDEALADPRFLYYVFCHRGSDLLQLGGGGSVYANVSKSRFSNWEINLPPLEAQRAIASILSAFDDKIELNRRTAETLEAMARAVFKSWFVDFDPVHAKAAGRLPDLMDAETAALFPDRFGEDGLPEGWRQTTIGSCVGGVSSGGTPKRAEPSYWEDGTIPWFRTGDLDDGPLIAAGEHITDLGLAGSSCKLWPPGTLLLAMYASPTVGRMGMLEIEATANQACAALTPSTLAPVHYLRHWLLETRDWLQRVAVGAAQQNINLQIVRDHVIMIPGQDVVDAFEEAAILTYRRQLSMARENELLCAIRDALLPRLLSGELRVDDAEKVAEGNL
jgi:type I restriction enzyme S subunit